MSEMEQIGMYSGFTSCFAHSSGSLVSVKETVR
ncbi:hypothetical protein M3J09_004400 [Ascochyta lentis]